MLYWLGRSKALVDPAQAFPTLEAAYESFTVREDNIGQLLCAAEVVETLHFAVTRFESMGLWLERLERSLGAQKTPLQTDDELRVHSTLFWAAENSDPCSPVIAPSVARVQQLLPRCTDVNLRVSVANMLHYHSVRSGDSQAAQIAMREARPYLNAPELSADRLALYFLAEGMAHVDPCRYGEALACYDRADSIIEAHGLGGRDHIARVWRAMCQYAAGDVQNAHATLVRIETLRSEDLPVIAQVLLNARAWVAFSRDEIESALKHVQAAVENIDKWGPSIVHGWNLPNQAYMQISTGRVLQARDPLKKVRSQSWLGCYGHFQGTVALLEAWEALRTGKESRCHDALRESLELAKDERDRLRMRWYPKALAELLPVALERGIETDTARTLIRECRLSAPAHPSDAWPWAIKVYTLGRFEILIDDKPLEFGRKAPKRTLALLKALIALGGAAVSEQKLIDSLWPDLEADAAAESLAAALHRLRRLLGGNDLIRQNGGLLSLNTQRTFVDAWAFEAGTDDPAKQGSALKLYRGGFLHGDNEPWAASLRERLRGKFVRTVESVSSDLESSRRWQEAIELYVRGIGTDDLIEPFYRGLMRCYSNLGRHAEAAGAFRRLRQTLSITLGTKPSTESQRLFETLRL